MNTSGGKATKNLRLCIDTYERGSPTGRLYDADRKGDGEKFRSAVQMILKIEKMLDDTEQPKAETIKRSFKALPPPDSGPGGSETGIRGTFLIQVMFRQHASWQGSVTWVEGEGVQSFRSTLELLLLIDSALGGCE